jgi:hypothetical protein
MSDAVPAVQPEECDALAVVTGSGSQRFRNTLLNDLRAAVVPAGASDNLVDARFGAAIDALRSFAPRDEIEGMMAVQAVALHSAVLAGLRQALTPGLEPEISDRLRRQAAKLSRAFLDLTDAVERRRHGNTTKQVVRIERVDVSGDASAIIGAVTSGAAAPRGRRGS